MALLLKNVLFTVVVPGTVAVYIPLTIVDGGSIRFGRAAALGLFVIAVGAAIYAWCVWDFATFGRGTPAPIDAPKRLVNRGLYQYIRNPMYVGVVTVILGWALLFRSGELVAYGALVLLVFHLVVVLYEEPRLREAFGDEYDTYRTEVGRWLPKSFRGKN